MSRELWADESCLNANCEDGVFVSGSSRTPGQGEPCVTCRGLGRIRRPLDFDAIWRRYYDIANRRFEPGLTYNELWFVVTGEKKEEE